MYVHELKAQLDKLPADVWVDVMFPDGSAVYTITGVELFKLAQGEQRAVIDIADDMPLRAV